MIKRMIVSSGVMLLLMMWIQTASAYNGQLFSIQVAGSALTINTVVPHHLYPSAGIKINTAGYSLANPGTDCTPISNGYCLLSVSDTQSKTISLKGNIGGVGITLCLNGNGPLS